jgi:hypothetical protein
MQEEISRFGRTKGGEEIRRARKLAGRWRREVSEGVRRAEASDRRTSGEWAAAGEVSERANDGAGSWLAASCVSASLGCPDSTVLKA